MMENSLPPPLNPPVAPALSVWQKLGLGAALVAVPAGTVALYAIVRDSAEASRLAQEQGSSYDLAGMQRINPSLIKYRQIAQMDTQMQTPRVVAVAPDGRVLVAGDQLVRIFSAAGKRLSDLPLTGAPYCVAAAPDGKIYVGLKDHVEIFSSEGKLLSDWSPWSRDSFLTGIAVAGEDIYVADAGRRVVLRCNAEGKVLAELGQADQSQNYPGLVVPSPHLHVAIAPDGLVWVNNPGLHRLEAFNAKGELQRYWGEGGTGVSQFLGCCNPVDFSLLANGGFVTAEKGISRVKVYSADGQFESVVAGPDSFTETHNVANALSIVTDPENHVLVLEPGTSVVRLYGRSE